MPEPGAVDDGAPHGRSLTETIAGMDSEIGMIVPSMGGRSASHNRGFGCATEDTRECEHRLTAKRH